MSAPRSGTFIKIRILNFALRGKSRSCLRSTRSYSTQADNVNRCPSSEDEGYINLCKQVSRWQILPYDLQLEKINSRAALALKKLTNIVRHVKRHRLVYFLEHCDKHAGLPCELLPVRPSPIIDHCRNKDHLVIGLGDDGLPDVGFSIRSAKSPGMVVCGLPLRTQKTQHSQLCKIFTKFVRASGFPAVGEQQVISGGWKLLLMRSNQKGEMMVAPSVNPKNISRDKLDQVQESVQEFLIHGEGRQFDITSLYHREVDGFPPIPSTPETAYKHIHGQTHLTETLLGKQFQIHPESFFQVNTLGAEVLYETIAELAQLRENTVLLDVCCGTGTIGILLADRVKKVYGIEYIAAAVDDAKQNCALNGVTNIEYFCGRAEKLLRIILNEHIKEGDDVVAVVNPGRAGLGQKVTRALRRCKEIRRIVFASCNAIGRSNFNFAHLCRPADESLRLVGTPFLPIKAVPVDMFPATDHYELVVLFER